MGDFSSTKQEKLMKAIGTWNPLPLAEKNSLELLEIQTPKTQDLDLLVQVKAVSVNPVDYKIRRSRKSSEGNPVVLGWDASGVVLEVGAKVKGFKVGDKVYYAGDLTRQGSNAEVQAVDSRLVGLMPRSLDFVQAAALPLTALTAWEALFEKLQVPKDQKKDILIIGGAGGVGSLAVQFLKTLTQARVYSTSGRPESGEWLKSLGVAGLLDRKLDLLKEAQKQSVDGFDYVFSTTHTDEYLPQIPGLLRPFGKLVLIDEPEKLDIGAFKAKSQSVELELMFTKSLFQFNMASQGEILNHVAMLVDEGRVKTTLNKSLKGMTVENFKEAHGILEAGESIGKIVIEF